MNDHESRADGEPVTERPPRTALEHVTANLRPQPAIPAILMFLLGVMLPTLLRDPQAVAAGAGSWLLYVVPLGVIGSVALAIAAGFCSLIPQLAWLVLATWFFFAGSGATLPWSYKALAGVAMLAAAGMVAVQLWRVRTGRFVPTIRENEEE